MRTKFEVRIAVHVPEIIGDWSLGWGLRTSNLGKGWAYGVGGGTVGNSVGEFLLAIHTYYSYINTRLLEILDCRLSGGCEPPVLGKGSP